MNGFKGFGSAVRELIGYRLNAAQAESFHWYAQELIAWNQRFNLTAIVDPVEIDIKHFLDSLTCLKVLEFRPPGRVVDIGTGAGFPGIPIKLLFPQFELTLLESIKKKVDFCQHIIDALGLEGVRVIHARAETLGQDPDHRERYDWGIARAVAIAPVLLEYLLPFIRVGGGAILQKGETGPAEMHQAESALRILGAQVDQIQTIELPCVPEPRHIISVKKTAATPQQYPRRAGMAAKRPLKSA
ncbi:MAG: 16S rRNA (guanine(527)-N(7))-methyltransferase RsmG [Anaerolineales bacterium]|nr:MAG: 16S rRNA (guanine(527)-N(7))-methyltransferase RsmG [Anaerolineales bacterium]